VRDLAHQTALADARLAFDQDGVAGAGREPRYDPDEQPILVAPPDERRGIGRRPDRRIDRRDGRSGTYDLVDRHRIELQAIGRMHRRAASRNARRSSSGTSSDAASRSASCRDGRRSSASIFLIVKPEQLTRRASASWSDRAPCGDAATSTERVRPVLHVA